MRGPFAIALASGISDELLRQLVYSSTKVLATFASVQMHQNPSTRHSDSAPTAVRGPRRFACYRALIGRPRSVGPIVAPLNHPLSTRVCSPAPQVFARVPVTASYLAVEPLQEGFSALGCHLDLPAWSLLRRPTLRISAASRASSSEQRHAFRNGRVRFFTRSGSAALIASKAARIASRARPCAPGRRVLGSR
jgi:hypothetical protein